MINRQTEDYIRRLEEEEKSGKEPQVYHASPDAIDQLIIENNLRISGISFYPQLDLLVVVLSNRRILKRNLSDFKRLAGASLSELQNYELSPMGIHWADLDEDLSLRGFLKHELAFSDNPQIA